VSTDHDAVRVLLGAYVLGGLGESDRLTLEAHLPVCEDCREELARLAPLPGLLRRASRLPLPPPSPAGSGEADPAVPAVRAARLDEVLDEVRAIRTAGRRGARLQRLALAAALIVVAGLTLALLVPFSRSADPSGPTVAFSPASGSAISGHATLTAKPWGTAVSVDLADLPDQGPFVLRVTSDDSRTEQAATWSPTPTAAVQVAGASSLRLSDIASVAVLDSSGRVLATTPSP
jgi:hypothetical protein